MRQVRSLLDPWVWAAIAAAIALRLVRLGDAPLWFDETFTAQQVSLPWGEMLRTVIGDNQMPLYYVVLKAWRALVGDSAWALRVPSLVFSTALVPLSAALAGTLAGRSAARWAAWLTALSPWVIHHGQEARAYTLVATLAAAHLLVLARFATGASRKLGGTFVIGALLLIAVHHTSVFFLSGELLAAMLLWRRPLRMWLPAVLTVGAAMLAAPVAALFVAHGHAGSDYDLGIFALPGLVWSLLCGYTLLPTSEALHALGVHAALPYLPFGVVAALAVAVIGTHALRAASRAACIVLGTTLIVTLLAPFAASAVIDMGVHPRYCAAATPVLLVLLALGCPTRPRLGAQTIAVLALGATMTLATTLHFMEPGHGREDVRSAGQWLDANVPLDEEVLVTSGEMLWLAQFHWPARRFALYPSNGIVATQHTASDLASHLPFSNRQRAVYVVGREWLSDPSGALQRALSDRYAACGGTQVRGIRILCVRQPDELRAMASWNSRLTAAPIADLTPMRAADSRASIVGGRPSQPTEGER